MKPFTMLAAFIFLVVCVGHITRLCLKWQITLEGAVVPMWISVVGAIIAALLAIFLWRESRERAK